MEEERQLAIGAVIVTYNRLDKLKKALAAYEQQSFAPLWLLIVDNCSTDGTDEFLKDWQAEKNVNFSREVLRLSNNEGGSGGFYEGLKWAQQAEVDWIWVGDDDAYPSPDALAQAVAYLKNNKQEVPAAVCGAVITGGCIDTWHRRRLSRRWGIVREELVPEKAYENPFSVSFLSYVGSMIRREALLGAGLPERDFFISYDDSEHSLRLLRMGKIECVPAIHIEHDTNETETSIYSWKKYYAVRNKLFSYRRHFGIIQTTVLACYYYGKQLRRPVLRKMTGAAIQDAFTGKLGLHELYRPGWTAEMS